MDSLIGWISDLSKFVMPALDIVLSMNTPAVIITIANVVVAGI